MNMDIRFPHALSVEAAFKGFTVVTDQPAEAGGQGSAPTPFDLFLASIGTCAGLYALRFCQQRGLSTEELGLTLHTETDRETHRVSGLRLEIRLPEGFPAKYRDAIVRSVDQCAVKRHILEPPRFEVTAVPAAELQAV